MNHQGTKTRRKESKRAELISPRLCASARDVFSCFLIPNPYLELPMNAHEYRTGDTNQRTPMLGIGDPPTFYTAWTLVRLIAASPGGVSSAQPTWSGTVAELAALAGEDGQGLKDVIGAAKNALENIASLAKRWNNNYAGMAEALGKIRRAAADAIAALQPAREDKQRAEETNHEGTKTQRSGEARPPIVSREDIERLGVSQVIVAQALALYRHGDVNWEETLLCAVKALAEANQALMDQLLDAYTARPMQVTIDGRKFVFDPQTAAAADAASSTRSRGDAEQENRA